MIARVLHALIDHACSAARHLAAVSVGGRRHLPRLALAILEARGWRTRREFADAVGSTEQTVYNWETGRTRPSKLRHVRALQRQGVPLEVLLEEQEPSAEKGEGAKPI
jgi:transcriptional regulator with XRE-family HTH domain